MIKKAIYFNDEYNSSNPAGGAICITYDKITGFQFVEGDKVITVTSKTDATQNTELELLKQEISDLKLQVKLQANGGQLVEKDTEGVETIITNNISGVVATDITKNISIVNNATPVEKKLSVKAKNVDIDGLDIVAKDKANPTITIVATGAVDTSDLKVTGKFESNTNQFDIQEATEIKITQSTFDADGYNTIMIGQGNCTVLPSSIIIEDVDFNMTSGNLSNNTVNIFATADDAEVIIRDCEFGEASNPIRFGNSTNASGVNVIIENCHFVKWEEKRPWCGVILFEDFEDWTLVQKDFPPTADEGNSTKNKDYRKRVLPELIRFEDEQNRFGKDKIKVTFKKCTYGPNKTPLVFDAENYGSLFGTGNDKQIAMVCRYSGYSSINAAYDEKIKAENDGKYPEGRTWYAAMFPYSNGDDYLKVIAAPDGIELKNKNSDCYPTIIFE